MFRAFTIIGLLLIAFGSGGIKPCVAAFGGDQFKMPEQTAQMAIFFSLFYFAINLGSLISTSITPILREDVHCFEREDCFSLAFGVPGALMFVSIIIFVCGKSLYITKEPAGNMFVQVCKCIKVSIRFFFYSFTLKLKEKLLIECTFNKTKRKEDKSKRTLVRLCNTSSWSKIS